VRPGFFIRLVALGSAVASLTAIASAQSATGIAPTFGSTIPMRLTVDTSDVGRGYVHVKERIAVKPGRLTLAYPKWIPGEHQPSGPLGNVATLEMRANGARLAWTRDPVELYTYFGRDSGGRDDARRDVR